MTKALPHIRTIEQIKADARKAFDEKRLGFQLSDKFAGDGCLYAYRDEKGVTVGVCVIGSTLPDPLPDEIEEYIDQELDVLDVNGLVKIVDEEGREDAEAFKEAKALQEMHDGLVGGAHNNGRTEAEQDALVRDFLKAIDHPSVKDI
jgi:hypothetical protein